MQSSLIRRAGGMAIALTLLAACAGGAGGSGVPAASSVTSQGAAGRHAHAYLNLSGEYAGKFVDNFYGKGKGNAVYAQYQSAFGGQLTIKYATTTLAASVSQTVSGSSVNGSTAGGAGSLYCTFSTTATYDTATHVLSGSYAAAYGCAGESGTFQLKHQCTFKGTSHDEVRPDNGPRPC